MIISTLHLRAVCVFCLLRAIVNHFNPKIESYAAVNHISQLSEEQVHISLLGLGLVNRNKRQHLRAI